jgi:putative ABC transport system permease protein
VFLLLKYSLKSIWSRKLITSLFTLGLIVVLVISMLSVNITQQIKEGFFQQDGQYDIVIGNKGSATSLVMSALFFSAEPLGKIDYKYYADLKDRKDIQLVVPMAMGDNYRGANIVGTTPDLLRGKSLKDGKMFDPEVPFQAVVGANVAQRFKLKVGDVMVSSHGLGVSLGVTSGHEEGKYTLVGILDTTNTSYDNTFFTGVISIFDVHGIDANGHGRSDMPQDTVPTVDTTGKGAVSDAKPTDHTAMATPAPTADATAHEDERGFTSILIRTGNMMVANELLTKYKDDTIAQAVNPTATVRQLMTNIDLSKQVAQLLCYIIIALSLIMIAIMTVLMFESTKKDVQTLRFIGLSRLNIIKFVFYQNIFLVLVGVVISLGLSRFALQTANTISSKMGIIIDPSKFYVDQWYVLAVIVGLCLIPVVFQLRKLFKEML